MSIKITIDSTAVETKSGTSARTGKPYNIPEQNAWAHTTDRDGKPQLYPQKIKIVLRDGQPAYPVGEYTVAPSSFFVDRFGALTLGLVLKPLVAQASKPGLATQGA